MKRRLHIQLQNNECNNNDTAKISLQNHPNLRIFWLRGGIGKN